VPTSIIPHFLQAGCPSCHPTNCWMGHRKGIRPVKNLFHISLKVLFHNWRRKKTKKEPADPGSNGKRLLN